MNMKKFFQKKNIVRLVKIAVVAWIVKTIIFLIVFTSLTTCKKYDEGPLLSLKSKKGRMVGKWKVEKVIDVASGADITTAYQSSLPNLVIEYKKDGSFTWTTNTNCTGTWEFDDNKERLYTTFTGSADRTSVVILRLTNKELWVKTEEAINNEEIHYAAE